MLFVNVYLVCTGYTKFVIFYNVLSGPGGGNDSRALSGVLNIMDLGDSTKVLARVYQSQLIDKKLFRP
jgi:hypothetical protein